LDEVPVLLVVLADLRELAAMDRDNGRYTYVGGATVYPFAWNIMLAARDEGLVGVLTTLFSRTEPEVRQALGIPAEFSVAAGIALGHPLEEPAEPRRATVEQFTSIDELSGPAFTISGR
jgi:nitroreductase